MLLQQGQEDLHYNVSCSLPSPSQHRRMLWDITTLLSIGTLLEFILIRCRSFQGHLSFTAAKLLLCLLPGEHRKAMQVGSHGTGTATVPRGKQNCTPEDAPCCTMAAAASLYGTTLGMEPASSWSQMETLTQDNPNKNTEPPNQSSTWFPACLYPSAQGSPAAFLQPGHHPLI